MKARDPPAGKLRPETEVAHRGRDPKQHLGAVNTPVYRASTILFESIAELEAGALAVAAGLPVHELEAVGGVPVAEVRRREQTRALEWEGADVLDEGPALGGRPLDVLQQRQPVEIPQAADDVVAESLPL